MNAQPQPPPQAVADLPVFATLLAAFPATYGNPGLLLRAASGGLMLIAITAVLFLIFPNVLTLLLLGLFGPLAAYTHFGVNWYRIILLGPDGLVRPTLRWDGRHWRVFAYAFAINIVTMVAQVLLTLLLPDLFSLPIALGVFYVTARLSFIFPALSVEEDYSLQLSWQHTRGQGLRLASVLLMAGVPLYLLVSLIFEQIFAALIGAPMAAIAELAAQDPEMVRQMLAEVSPVAIIAVMMIFAAMTLAVLAVEFTIVAIAFRTCTGWVAALPGQIAEVFGDDSENDRQDGDGGQNGPGGGATP